MSRIVEFLQSFHPEANRLALLAESGSNRKYYRFYVGEKAYLLTENANVEENKSFFYLSKLFKNLNGSVPEVLKVNDTEDLYIQEDLGNDTLLQLKLNKNPSASTMYEVAVKKLSHLQIGAHQIMDYDQVSGFAKFDDILVLRDLFLFKNYFLDLIELDYSEKELLQEFSKLTKTVGKTHYRYFMFRDFQGRNIMVHEGQPYFIDYQDGMEGPIAYDLVSLLWQAKAKLSPMEKEHLYTRYCAELKMLIPQQFSSTKFREDYNICVIIRLLQVMGTYGKLGILQQKEHFRDSLSFGIDNLIEIAKNGYMDNFPVLKTIALSLSISQLSNNNI